MTIPYKGTVRYPGPIGMSPGGIGGRLPGPLGFGGLVVSQSSVTKVVTKSTTMPPPTNTSTQIEARQVDWKLFPGAPAVTDVRQGELATCPIASILAALAHTEWGRDRIKGKKGIVKEVKAPAGVKTTLSAAVVKQISSTDPDDRKQKNDLISDRYFTVALKDPPLEVSDVFYVEYTDGTIMDPLYMQHRPSMSPEKAREALWPAVIEKAYAHMIGNYEKLDDYGPKGITVDVYWTAIVGSKPTTIHIKEDTDLSIIRKAAEAASRLATIGASRETTTKVSDKHGYAVLGIQGSRIELYDPWGKSVKITLEEFRTDFSHIFQKA